MKRHRVIYSVVRYVPDVFREEFINVGVMVSCPELQYRELRLLESFDRRESKFSWLEGFDGQFLRHTAQQMKKAFEGEGIYQWLSLPANSPLEHDQFVLLQKVQAAGNLRVSAPRSAGAEDPQKLLERLFVQFVGQNTATTKTKRVDRTAMRRSIHQVFAQQGLFEQDYVKEEFTLPLPASPQVDFAYKNHVLHCYQAIPFGGDEGRVLMQVNSYRQLQHDARTKGTLDEVKNAQFVILAHLPESTSGRLRGLLEVIHEDGIDVQDYQHLEAITAAIQKDMKHDLMLN